MSDLKKLPYAEWLERSLQHIVGNPIQSICILTKNETGEVGTGYYECSAVDKLLFASYLQHDAVIDTVNANGILDDNEEDEDGDE
jgi:hypothetical protein